MREDRTCDERKEGEERKLERGAERGSEMESERGYGVENR